ncbi:hypothetical protein H8959_009652 [Pygathrix nigripes]
MSWPRLIRKFCCYLKEIKNLCKLVFCRCHHYTSDNYLEGHLEALGALLEKVAATLETLILEGCQIHYSQLSATLPGLSHCSQLTTFYFGRNFMSMDALKDLLGHTSGLSKLSLETYPAPDESLNSLVHVDWEIFTPLRAELMRTLREVRQPRRIFIGPAPCPSCGSSPSEELELHLCC